VLQQLQKHERKKVSSQQKTCPEFLHLVVDEEDMHNVVGDNMVGVVLLMADTEREVHSLQEVDKSGSIP
jgi:hypothetical protein